SRAPQANKPPRPAPRPRRSSPRRRRRSPGWPPSPCPTGRSPPGCSSAPAPSNTTCARSSASLASAAGLSSPGRSARARGPSSPRPEERYGLLLTRVRSSGAHEGVIGAGWDRDVLVPGWGVGDDGRAPSYGLGRGGLVWSRREGWAITGVVGRTAETPPGEGGAAAGG